jgi:hypothetical protein
MKILELLLEKKQELTKDQQKAIPSMTSVGVPGLPMGPTNYYHKYRLGVHMAGSPEDHHPYPTDSQYVDDMVMVGYSKADRDIIAHSVKAFGYKQKTQSPKDSKELNDTGKKSPVSGWNSGKIKKK